MERSLMNNSARWVNSESAQKGNILLTVLWIIIALVIITLGLTQSARMDIERTRVLKEKTRAYWIARSGIEKTKFDYAATRSRIEEELKPKTKYLYEFEEGYALCYLESESAKMPINSKNADLWKQALSMFDLDDMQKESIIACIFDWTDQDSELNPEGAEDDYYQSLNPPYSPRNGPFLSVDEITLVKGIEESMFYGQFKEGKKGPGLKDLLGMGPPNNAQFDINSCSKEILMAFLEITEEEAEEIITVREEQAFENVQEVGSLISIEATDKLNKFFSIRAGNHFTIKSTGFVYDSPVRYTVEEEVRYIGGPKIFSIVSHKDFSLDHADEVVLEDEDDE